MDNASSKEVIIPNMQAQQFYTDEYKNTVFSIWYLAGKPRAEKLKTLIEPNSEGEIPCKQTLIAWIKEFFARSSEMDALVNQKLEEATIQEKVAMLEHHAKLAVEMQDIAMKYLRDNKDKLNPHSAVRLLVDGIRVERESRGLSSMIIDISRASNDDLEKMLDDILNHIDISPEELESDTDDQELSDL